MPTWIQTILSIIIAAVASTGLWNFIQKKSENKDAKTKMLMGLAHDRIIYLGMCYIDRGWIAQDEYENLNDYLYKPYEELGFNGFVKRVMEDVRKLPLKNTRLDIKYMRDVGSD